MIENREQRKKSSLLRRRKIIIIISVLVVIALGVALYFVYDYVNNVVPYTDAADGKEYYFKVTNGLWMMYDKDGNLLKKEDAFGYYVTESGTLVELREETGEYFTRAVPDISDGELTEYEKVLIFKHIEQKNVLAVEVHNANGAFTLYRYNVNEMKVDKTCDFALRGSPLLTLKKEIVTSLIVSAGYPLATARIDDYQTTADGKIDFSEYGLAPEKRTKLDLDKDGKPKLDENGNPIIVEYDYEPAYYVLTTVDGEKYKMLIGDRLINGGGFYARYVEIDGDTEIPRDKVYVLGTSVQSTLLGEAKYFVTPGIAYPVTQSDYFDVENFTISKKDGEKKEEIVSFSYIDIADRTGTVRGSKPYVFTDGRKSGYCPNYDKIDTCLLAFMKPTIVGIAVLSPTQAQRAEYGLMKQELDADGKPILDDKGNPKYVYDSEYVVSFKREAKDNANQTVNFLQTVYISKKNENGNYYSYTTLTFLDNTEASDVTGITFDMICEVSGDTYSFLTYDQHDWIYPYVLETGIKYTTAISLNFKDYEAKFDITNIADGDDNAISIKGSNNKGGTADTFGLLKFKDQNGNNWTVSQTDVKVFSADGKELAPTGKLSGTNDIGEKIKYLEKPVKDADGNIIYVKLNEIKIDYVNGESKSYLRHHTMIFKKFYQSLSSLAIIDDYSMTAEEEAVLIADPEKHIISVSISDNENNTINLECYTLTARKAYIKVNGEGGYYVSTSALETIIENCNKFFNQEDIAKPNY